MSSLWNVIRSTTPDQQSGATSFYEVLLSSQGSGQFALRRYRSQKGVAGRDQVEDGERPLILGSPVPVTCAEDVFGAIVAAVEG